MFDLDDHNDHDNLETNDDTADKYTDDVILAQFTPSNVQCSVDKTMQSWNI